MPDESPVEVTNLPAGVEVTHGLFLPDSLPNVNMVSTDGSTFTFSYTGNMPDIDDGYVLACSDDYGYLRKITSYSVNGNNIIIQTTDISLTEFLSDANVEQEFTLEISPSRMHPNGPMVEYRVQDGIEIVNGGILINDYQIFPAEGTTNPNMAITIDGHALFEPGYEIGFDIADFTLERFYAQASGQLSFEADVTLDGSAEYDYSREEEVFSATYRQWIGMAAIIPIWAKVELSFVLGIEFDSYITATATTGFDATAGVTVGAQYYQGSWQRIWNPYNEFNAHPFTWSQDAGVMCRAYVRPEISIELCDVAGPYIDIEPYLKLNAETHDISDWSWALTAGADASLGFRVHILSYSIADYNTNILSIEDTIASASSGGSPDDLAVDIENPVDGATLSDRDITVSGTIDNFTGTTATLTINGHDQTIPVSQPGGTFSNPAVIISGSNTIRVTATEGGDTDYDEISVTGDFPPAEIWVQLSWNADMADVDLYVTEPDGGTSWYSDKTTSNGGELDVDDTDGYGPEHYYISEGEGDTPPSGNYEIRVHYYSNHGWTSSIPVKIVVYRNEVFFGEYTHTLTALSDNSGAAGPGGWDTDPSSWWEVVDVPLTTARPVPERQQIKFAPHFGSSK